MRASEVSLCLCDEVWNLEEGLGCYVNVRSLYACVLGRFSPVQLFEALGTVACHAPLYIGFTRQESWSGLPFPSPGDLPTRRPNPSLHWLLHCRQSLHR